VALALGVPSLLLSNSVAGDARGIEVGRWLRRCRVATPVAVAEGAMTPEIVVVADEDGTRTWFPFLPGVVDALNGLDLAPLAVASFAYVDCYELIEVPAVRAIRAAQAAGVPLLLNLGGSPLSSAAADVLAGYPRLVVQTNVDDAAYGNAPQLAATLRSATDAQWVVVTAGAFGAVAVSHTQCLTVSAFRAAVRHPHCAGAAFSGGMLYGLLHAWPMIDSLSLASASGALRCERAQHEPMPSLAELRAFMDSRERIGVPTA
jgi:sugar/nucleoside kinase (ribokinase family)